MKKLYRKYFFIEYLKGKRCFEHYRKIKPTSIPTTIVNASPPKNTYYKNLLNLPTCFFLKNSLKYEKFWRTKIREESSKEMFLGVSPTAIRLLDPVTLESSIVIEITSVFEFKNAYHLGDHTLKIKYYQIEGAGNTKSRKLVLLVFPITRNNIKKWYDICVNGEANDIGKLKKSKSTSSIVSDRTTLAVSLDGKEDTNEVINLEVPSNYLQKRKSTGNKENTTRLSRKGINYC